MSIATKINNHSGNLLFKMMLAKQQTTDDTTKPPSFAVIELDRLTYNFEDNSSITFATDAFTNRVTVTTGVRTS